MDTRPQQAFGIEHVAKTVQYHWKSGWQELQSRNDDSTDGLIFLRRKGKDTGDIVFVQVKCGTEYRHEIAKRPLHIGVKVGEDYIRKHRPRWESAPGPMLMIYVDPSKWSQPEAFWTDLRDPGSFSVENKQIVLFSKSQRFGLHSKGSFIALCKSTSTDRALPVIVAKRDDINYFALGSKSKGSARRYYHAWSNEAADINNNPVLGCIEISRIGWRHMSRRGRKPERIMASWGLLGIGKRIIRESRHVSRLGRCQITRGGDGSRQISDYLALRAKIVFPHRGDAVVQVVIRRKRSVESNGDTKIRYWLYSIYELRRGGVRGY